MRRIGLITLLGATALAAAPAAAQAPMLDSTMLAAFRWRSVGPANMGGRVSDVEGIPSPSKTYYVAAAAGGVWKTMNNGTTFELVWEGDGRVISMGDIAIAPSDTNVVYLGTGEGDSRNSISPGGGIFKSTDGGKSWQNMGLKGTQTVGRIVVHPTDPNTVYVAALGAIWGSNPERGLYKTTDGGRTWTISKFISDKAGFTDVVMHPNDPNTLWAASYERVRGPYFLNSGGPGSALWKTTDAGATWAKVSGGGWPTSMLGRVGLAISPSNPEVLYAIVEADTLPNARPASGAARQTRPSGLYRSADGGTSWTRQNDRNVRPFYYSQVRVHPTNPDRVWFSSTPVNVSDDGGKTYRNTTVGIHVDHHAMWIDPNDPDRMVVGNDGGVAITYDGGGTYDFLNNMALGQFYNVSFDMAVPYNVCGGLQDNGSWCGPSRLRGSPNRTSFWATVNGGDGFHTAQDPTDANIVYAESQGGNIARVNMATGERFRVPKPTWRDNWLQYEDSIVVSGNDSRRVQAFRAAQKADSAARTLRWNWNTPFLLSPHNPSTFYMAANRVMKSTKRGEEPYFISPDLTTQNAERIRISTRTTGGITPDVTQAETYSTIVSLAESPIRPGLLYAGTDDGNVWLTRNDGVEWENLTTRIRGVPALSYVTKIEPSSHDSSTFYVTFDNHRENDFTPYVYMTSDFGKSFRSIASNLPTDGIDFVHVIREDPVNPNLLFVGTDVGAYVSIDRGGSWSRFMTGLATVPVHDLKIHPRDRELIAGTHGRSIWVVDIAPLQQMTATVASRDSYLFQPKPAFQWSERPAHGESNGHGLFQVANPPFGAEFVYRLATASSAPVRVAVLDVMGDTIASGTGGTAAGLHRMVWDMRGRTVRTARALSPAGVRDSIAFARDVAELSDSLIGSGSERAAVERTRDAILSGQGIGGGGGGGGGNSGINRVVLAEQPFAARPGETTQLMSMSGPVRAGGAPAQRGGQQGAGDEQQAINAAFRPLIQARGFGGGGGGGGGRGDYVNAGDYLIVVQVGSDVHKQLLRVERVGALANSSTGASEVEVIEDRDHDR